MEEINKDKIIRNFISKGKNKLILDPIYDLLNNYPQIKNLLKLNKLSEINIYYFLRKQIHKILYYEEEFINFKFIEEINKNLSDLFYLVLLLEDNPEITNYSYPFDFITKIDDIQKKTNDKYAKLFFGKIIIDLICNYIQLDIYNEEEEENILSYIRNENLKIIKNNLSVLEEMNINLSQNNFLSKKIDELLSYIIKSLIIKKKLENTNIIKYLDLENFDITETIFNSLCEILDKDKGYINNYIIKDKKDLLKDKNIEFYYIILKYILKNSIYIYHIPLLLELRKFIIKLIKSNEILYNGLDYEEKKSKLEYIVKTLTDSEYYFNISKNNYVNQLTEVLNYYKDFKFISKKEDINIIQDIIKNNKKDGEIYLRDYENAKNINIRAPIIKYLINSKGPLESSKDENIIETFISNWYIYENMIKKKKLIKMRKDIKELLKNYFIDEKNKNFLLKIFNQDEIDLFNNKNKRKLLNEEKYERKDNREKYYLKKYNDNENKLYEDKSLGKAINAKNKISSEKKVTGKNSEVYKNNNKEIKESNISNISKKNKKINDYLLNILQKCKISFHTNEKGKEPFFIYDKILIGDINKAISYEYMTNNNEINEYLKKNGENILVHNYKKLLSFLKEIEDKISKEFMHNYKLEITLELKKENIKVNTKSSLYNISCTYLFKEPKRGKTIIYEKENILVNGTINFLLYDINLPKYKDLNYINNQTNNNELKLKSKEVLFNSKKYFLNIGQKYFIDPKKKLITSSQIIKLLKTIEVYKNTPSFIKELDNGDYISGDSEKNIILYDPYLNKKENNKEEYDKYFYKPEISKKNFKIICSDNKINEIIKLNEKELQHIKNNNNHLNSNKIKISYEEESSLLFNNENINPQEIRNNSLEDLISNMNKITSEEESINNHKVLISDYKKNGIFLENKLGGNNLPEEYSYDTKNFEIYCLCQLLIVLNLNKNKNLDNININEEYKKNIRIIETDFFLVGGFDNYMKEGQIKFFRIEYGNKLWKTKIIFIDNIIIPKNNNEQLGPITNIIQSKISGYISATCLNGNVYMFSEPKII